MRRAAYTASMHESGWDGLIQVAGTEVHLCTDEPRYGEYLRLHFGPDIRAFSGEKTPIHVEVRWDHPRPFQSVHRKPLLPDGSWTSLARGLARQGGRIRWQMGGSLPGLTLEAEPSQQGVHVRVWFHWAESWFREWRRLSHPHHAHRTLRQLTYYTVYYPALWWMGRQGWRLLHAAGVAVEGKALAILGPAGSGKSSLALALLRHAGVRLLSDNLLLYRDGQVQAVYEPIRMAARRSVDYLNTDVVSGLHASPLCYSSRLRTFHVEPSKREPRASLRACLFPELGSDEKVNLVPWSAASPRFVLAQCHALEVADFTAFQSALGIIDIGMYQDNRLGGCGLSTYPAWIACLPRSGTSQRTAETILEALS